MVVNTNFRDAFELRFAHYFSNEQDTSHKAAEFYYLEKFEFDTVQFLGIRSVNGYDPELIVVNTDSMILLLYRGTDDVDNNRFAEWKGTDFKFARCESDSIFNQAKIHSGFYRSFNLIRDDLKVLLDSLNAKDKAIWISGHSLGGSMAILTAVYLQQTGIPVENVYTYATPRALGDEKLASLCDSILTNKIHRFEYYLDPVTILWKTGFENIGKRYWFDNATKANYAFYPACSERRMARWPLEYRRRPFANDEKREKARIKRELNDLLITDLPAKLFYHNTQWYVYATYKLLPDCLKSELPKVDDSYPFIYYGWNKAK
jgi:pimeloyl-ACP methyl ester carboxylesterase